MNRITRIAKKTLCLIAACAMFPLLQAARAEVYAFPARIADGLPEMTFKIEQAGIQKSPDWNEETIYRLTVTEAENPQKTPLTLYFCAQSTTMDMLAALADVDFDGYKDLEIRYMTGASNIISTFYLWDKEAGMFTSSDISFLGLTNYTLYPETGMITSFATGGMAGLIHTYKLYGWENGKLKLLRSSVWGTYTEESVLQEGEDYAVTTVNHNGMIEEVITDYMQEEPVELFREAYQLSDYSEEFYTVHAARETKLMWQGFKSP